MAVASPTSSIANVDPALDDVPGPSTLTTVPTPRDINGEAGKVKRASPKTKNMKLGPNINEVIWDVNDRGFVKRFEVTTERETKILHHKLNENSSQVEVFYEMFPRSLILHIVACTNKRLHLLRIAR